MPVSSQIDGLVLEDRLEHALAHLRLVRRVRGQELAAREHDVGDGGDVVVVDPRAEERELGARVHVPRGELLEVAHELGLAERGFETSSSRPKRTPGGICSNSSSTDETPIAASISSRSASVSDR